MYENEIRKNSSGACYRPELTLYHPNMKGSGSALRLSLYPASCGEGENVDGCIMLTLAAQKDIADRNAPNRKFASFDWENKVVVKLDFSDLCKFLQIFRGECEAIDEGRGLVHIHEKRTTRISLKHLLEPRPMYALDLYRNAPGSHESDRNVRFLMTNHEALGICAAVEQSMGLICFGIPREYVRRAVATKDNPVKEAANGIAAA